MDGRTLDKRKARDKETDSDTSDTSLNKNPTKRPRVDYSPKEKSPSPASAQKSPLGKASVADSCTAATPEREPALSQSQERGEHSNGDDHDAMAMAGVSSSVNVNNNDNDHTTPPPVISKFDLPSPYTTQELEQKIGKVKEEKEDDSDSDNGSTKFLKGVLQQEEENKQKRLKDKGYSGEGGGMRSSNGNGMSTATTTTTTTAYSNAKRNAGTSTNSKEGSSGKNSHHPLMTSSPVSADLVTEGAVTEVEVTIKVFDPSTHQVLLEETMKSDTGRVGSFLIQHNIQLMPSLSHSSSSGYLADVSSEVTKSSSSGSAQSRWTMSSLGSTIPRQSIVSIATSTDASDSPDDLMNRPDKPAPVSKARKRSEGPIMSSTKIEEADSSRSSGSMGRMNVSSNQLANGDDHHSSSSKSPQQSPSSSSPPKKFRNTPAGKLLELDEGIGTSPNSTASPKQGGRGRGVKNEAAAAASPSNDSGRGSSAKKPKARRRGGSTNNFPITNPQTPPALSAVLSTPPPARSVARIEGTQAKPQSRFEQEMNNEPVVESDLQKSEMLWSQIVPQELVFARWRDKNYYSGMVQSKGMNDTWLIDFDDGMQDVASESHIIPIRILGVGVSGIYSPDERYEAKRAVIIGQKFQVDPDTGGTAVKYAIKCDGDSKAIWCSRRQLSIKESDAKKLRPDYSSATTGKPADVSTDNIVSGPRRRTRGETSSEGISQSETPKQKRGRKVVGGAFDASTADDKLLESSTPKGRGSSKGGRKTQTPAADVKKKRPSNTSSPQTKDASTSSPVKESPGKEQSPTRTQKSSAFEPGKKRSKKTLFQGMQFYLTASGGGDPGISGNPIDPPIPYDKDEYREIIESCGGEILDTVGNEQKENVFLISDSYARTVKYIYCLAAGIPCVSHSWIKQCLDNHEIVDWSVFTLPAGWSLEHQDLIQHHMRKPLKGCKIFVTSESDQLFNYWKPVLTAAEAVLLKPPRKKGALIPQGTEVVVTDHSESNPEIGLEAEALRLPVVKPEWLVQTIITGAKAHMYGTDKYKILANETEDSEEYVGDSSADPGSNSEHVNVAGTSRDMDFGVPD